jgi:hypothetical protein
MGSRKSAGSLRINTSLTARPTLGTSIVLSDPSISGIGNGDGWRDDHATENTSRLFLALLNRLGMNRDAGDLREMLLHAVFQRAGHVVDLRYGQASIHGAVAGHQDVVLLPDAPGGQSTTFCVAGKSSSVYNHV